MSSAPNARTWSTLLDLEQLDLSGRYRRAVVNLASSVATRQIEKAEQEAVQRGEDPSEIEYTAPDITDPDEVYQSVVDGNPPAWWPNRLDRLSMRITIQPEDGPLDRAGPHPIDPNSSDLGEGTFASILRSMCEAFGEPFCGNLRVELSHSTRKSRLGGWAGHVEIGTKSRRSGAGSSSKFAMGDEKEAWIDHLTEEVHRERDSQHRFFQHGSQMLNAAASVINATRGVNPTPPWMMEDGGGDDMPIYAKLALEGLKFASDAGLIGNPGDGDKVERAANTLMHQRTAAAPMHHTGPRGPRMLELHDRTPMAIDPAGPPPGYHGDVVDVDVGGEFDGVYIEDDHLLEDLDEFDYHGGTLDEMYDDPGYDDPGHMSEFDEAYDDPYDDWQEPDLPVEPELDDAPRATRSRSSDPFEGMSDEEVFEKLSDYIERHPDKKKVQSLGLKLATKLT